MKVLKGVTALKLENFRCYEAKQFELAPVTIITGPNGSGKTAILEALAYLSVAKSWRVDRDTESIKHKEPFFRVIGQVNNLEREVVVQRSPYFKRYKVDQISHKLTDILGELPTVLFQPDDSALVYGAPAYRRNALDRLLSQVIKGYAQDLQFLQKVLKQRNRLLRQIQEGEADATELPFWDEQLADATCSIQQARTDSLEYIKPILQAKFKELLPDLEGLEIIYHHSPAQIRFHNQGKGEVVPVLTREAFLKNLLDSRVREIANGGTLYGPHREDIYFSIDNHPADQVLSRGQARALILSWKLAELEYIEQKLETEPLLLLDDVLAEFDRDRRSRLLTLLNNYNTVITTTETEMLNNIPKDAKIITL